MPAIIPAVGLFIIGLYMTMKGGDCFVEAAARIAQASGVPEFVIGATIVSLCTTAPELTVSLLATVQGTPTLAVGNAVGSAICNTALILGLGALLMPSLLAQQEARIKGGLLLVITAVTGISTANGALDLPESSVLFVLLLAFLAVGLRSAASARRKTTRRLTLSSSEKWQTGIHFLLGAAAVVVGARLMVDNGVILARFLHVPESIIGLTLIALGTSLPELMTALAAIRRGDSALSAGNIIGANIVDLALVLPACTLVAGGSLPTESAVFFRDAPIAFTVMAIAFIPPMFSGRLRRIQGLVLLLCYAVYLALLMGVI